MKDSNCLTKFKETEIGLIPREWNVVDLGCLANFSNGKISPERKKFGKYPVYGANGIIGFSDEVNSSENSIILGRVGAYCGSIYFSNTKSWVTDNAIKCNAKENSESKFLYYLLSILGLNERAGGSGQPLINQTILNLIKVQEPSLTEQKQIAEILSSLDDKIKINRKINNNLEKIASSLFKRWFVDFEFPDKNAKPYKSNGGKIIESGLGRVPENWKIGFLGENNLTSFIKSGIDKFYNEKIYLDTASVTNSSIVDFSTKITINKRPSRANMQPQINSVWFAKMKNSRKLLFFDDYSIEALNNYILSTGFAGFKVKQSALYYIWTFILSNEFDAEKNSLCQGTTMQAINSENISKIKYLIPPDEILLNFNNFIKHFYQEVDSLKYQNNRLSEIRDSLLSRLMSGKIRVKI